MKVRRIIVTLRTPSGYPLRTKAIRQREDNPCTPHELIERLCPFINPLNLEVSKVGDFVEDKWAAGWPNSYTVEN
jgi:hypothetical protein